MPKVTVIVRKAYGAGYYVMGPEGAVSMIFPQADRGQRRPV